jgi:nitrate reductase NapAB chaperone NapD
MKKYIGKLFNVEVTRYYSKTITIVVEAEDIQDAKDKIETNQAIINVIDSRVSETPLSWDDESLEVYQIETEAV